MKKPKWRKFEKKNEWWLSKLDINEQVRIRNAYLGIPERKQPSMIDNFLEWMDQS